MNTEITIPVRVLVLRDSIAELLSLLSNLDVNSSSFKTLNKYILSMTLEMTKFEAMTSRSFGSLTLFNKANKSVEKMEDTLAKARIAMNDIKFPELKLSGAQLKEWDNLNNALDAAMKKFDNVKEKFKLGLLSDTGTSRLFETIDPKAMDKSYDELFNLIDNKTLKVGKKLAESKDKLDDFLLKKDSAHKRGSLLAGEGFTPESLGLAAFDKFFTKAANGALSFKVTPGQQGGVTHKAFVDFLKSEYSLGDKEVNDLLKYTTAPSLNSFVKKMGKQSNMFTRGWDAANFDQLHVLEQQVKDVEAAYNNYQEVLLKFSDASFTGDLTKAAGEIGEAYNKLLNELAGLNSKMKDFLENAVKGFKQGNIQQSLTAYLNELNNFKNTLASTNAEFLKLEQTKRTFSNMKMAISNFMGFYQVLNLTKRGVREAMTHIKDLDSVMNKISIVTDKSTSDLWGQVDAYSDMAQKYGVSIKGAYEVSLIYYQQGLDTSDVLTLTNETLKLSKISGLDYATTTDYMTTAMRGFKMETSDASRVVDVYSNLAAHTAVSLGELAVGMSKTASSLESVGASFEESSAMIATMVAVTRESSTNIGSAMKSIASRYGEMKKDMSAAFDAEGEALSYNKVDAALQSVGISLKDSSGQFRNMTDVIIELGEQWDTLDSVQLRYIATLFAGNRQQSRFLALVSNVDLLKSNLNYALDSENVGDVLALKALDSIESRTEQLKVAYQLMYTTIGAEDMWKGALSGLTNFMNTLNGMPKLFDKIPIGAAAMLYDVVNVIRSVGNKALEGVSSGILSGLMNDKDLQQLAASFMSKVNLNLAEELKKLAPKTEKVGADTANTMTKGATTALNDKNQEAAKPLELEKVAEPAKLETLEAIKNEEIKTVIEREPIQLPVELVPNKEALALDTKEAIEAGTLAANITPEKLITEVTDVQKLAIASLISELTQEVKVTVTADTGPAETAILNLNGKTITVNVDANMPSLGVSGGRFGGAVGSAYAAGTKKLLGELGPEMYVTNGHYYVAGTNGPEMIDLPDDAIVFNHLLTEDLLKKLKTSNTGKPITNEKNAIALAGGHVKLDDILHLIVGSLQILPSSSMLKVLAKTFPVATRFPGVWELTPFGDVAATLAKTALNKGLTDNFNEQFSNAITLSMMSGEIDGTKVINYLKNTLADMESGVRAAEQYVTAHPNDIIASRDATARRQNLEQDLAWFDLLFGSLSIPEDTAKRHEAYLKKLSEEELAWQEYQKEEAYLKKKLDEDKAEYIENPKSYLNYYDKQEWLKEVKLMDLAIAELDAKLAHERLAKIDEFNSANTTFLSAIGKPKSTDWTAGIPIEDAVRLRKLQAEAKELMLLQSGVPRTPSAARIAAGQLNGPLSEQWDSLVWRHWTTRNGNFVGLPLSPNVEYGPTITPNAQAGYLRTMDNLKAEAELIRRGESVHPLLGASLTLSALEERERYTKEVAEYEKRLNKETKSETQSQEKSRLELLQRVLELRAAIKTNPKDIDDLKEERNKLYDSLGDVNAKTANADIAKKIAIELRKEAIAADKLKLIDMHKGNKDLMRKLLPSDDNQLRSAAEHSANPEIRYEALKLLRNELNNTSEASKTMMDKELKAIDKTVNAQEQLNDKRQEGLKEAEKSTAAVDNLKEEKKAADLAKESENNLKETLKEKEIETAEDFKNKYEYDASSDLYSRKDNKGLALSSEEFEKALSKKLLADAEREFTNKYEYDSDADLYRAKNSLDKDLESEEYQELLNSVRDAAAEPVAPSIVPDVSALETAREKAEEPIKPPVVPDMTEANEKLDSWSNKLKNSLQYKGNTALGGLLSLWGSGLNMLTGLIKGDSQEALTAKGGLMAGSGIMKLVGGWMTGSPMAMATGLMNVISGVSTIIEDDTEKLQRLNKTAEELNNKAKQEKANYKTLENSIKKVNELEKKRYESEEAAEEYQNAVDNLTDKFPELIDGFDEFGNAIPDMISAEESLAEARKNSALASYDAARAELEALELLLKINFLKARETGSELSSYQFTTGTEEAIASDIYQRDLVESIIKASPDWMQNMYGSVTGFNNTTWNAALREQSNPNSALINLLYGAKGKSTFGTGDSFKETALNNLFNNILAPYINEEIGGMEGLNLLGMRDALSNLKPKEFSLEASDFLTFLDSYLNTMNNLEEALEAGGSSTVLKNRIDLIKNVDLKARLLDSEKAIDDISIINEAVESYNKALETDDFDLITKNYEYLEDVITELLISEDDNANYLNQYLGDIRSLMGTVGNSIKNIASTKSLIAAMLKREASEWFKSTYKLEEFVEEASGLTSIVTNALVELWLAAFDTGETTDDLTTWLNNNVKDSKVLADEANNLWLSIKDKMVDGELVSDNLTKMLNEPEHYNSNDIINYLSQVDAEIGDSLLELLVLRSLKWSNRVQDSLTKHINSLTEDRESENLNQLKRYIEDEGEFGQLTNYDRNYFTSVSNLIKTLENRGFTSLASAFLNNATELFGEIGLLEDKAALIAIFDSITKNGFLTAENISKIMKSATSAGVKEDSRLYSSLLNIYKMVSSNLLLAITAATDEFITTWGDSSKVLKKLTSGIEFTEATDLMALAEKILPAELGQENTLLNIKDFKTNGSLVALTSDKAIEFWNSYNDYMSLLSKNWETDLSNAAKNLSKLLNLPENTDLSQIQFSDYDIELLQDSLNNEEVRTWILTILGNTYDSVISEVEENGLIGYEFKDNLLISEITDIFNLGLTSTYNLMLNYNKYREFAANLIIKSLNWDKGNYSSLQETFQKQGIEDYTSRLKELASGARYEDWELNEPDIKNAVDKMTDGYSSFLSDVLEKGTENINIKQYEGILQGDASRIASQLSADMNVSDFVSQYYLAAGWTIEEANSKIIEANRKAREKSYDEVKELSNISKAGLQLDLTYTTLQLNKLYEKNLKAKYSELAAAKDLSKQYQGGAEYTKELEKAVLDLENNNPITTLANKLKEAGAILENGILTLTSKANMSAIADALAEASKQVGSGMAAELMDMAQDILKKYIDYINNGIEGKSTYTEATDLMRYAKANGATLEGDAFYQTADGLKLSTEAAISLYSTLDNVSAVLKSIVFDSLTKQLKENNKHYKDTASILARIGELNKQIVDITQDADESHLKLKETMEQELAIAKEMALSNYTTPNSSWDFSLGNFTAGEITNVATYYSTWAKYMSSMSQWSTTGRIDYDGFINLIGHVSDMALAIGDINFMGRTFTKNGLINGLTLNEILSALFSALRTDNKTGAAYFDKKVLSSLGFTITKGSTMMEGMYDYINAFLGVSTEDAENWNDIMNAFIGVDLAMKDSKDHKTFESFLNDLGIFDLGKFSTFLEKNNLTDKWNLFADNFYIGGKKLSEIMGDSSVFNKNSKQYSDAIRGIFQMLLDEEGWDKTKPLQSLALQLERFGIEEGEYHFGDKVIHIKNGKVIIEVDNGEEGDNEYTDSDGNTVSASSQEDALNKLNKILAEKFKKLGKEFGADIADVGDNGAEGYDITIDKGNRIIQVRYKGDTVVVTDEKGNKYDNVLQALDKAYEEFGNGMEKSEWYQSEGFQLDLDATGQSIFKAFTGLSGEIIGKSLGEAIIGAMAESKIEIPSLNLAPESINVDTGNIKAGEAKDYTVEGGTVTIKPKAVVIELPEELPSETEVPSLEEELEIIPPTSSLPSPSELIPTPSVGLETPISGNLETASAQLIEVTRKIKTEEVNEPEIKELTSTATWVPQPIETPELPPLTGKATYVVDFVPGTSTTGGPTEAPTISAKGTVGLAHAKSTLMGELGPEMVVLGNRYFVVGQNGPEFVDLDKDAIVFNHLQTRSLLEKGTSNTRGKAITNERKAVAYAKGNMSGGPAHKKDTIIKPKGGWDSKSVLSSQTGNKLKSLMEGLIKALDKWYNLLQEIAKIQAKLNKEEALRAKIQSELNKSGTEYYKSQKRSIAELEKEVKTLQELVDALKKEREKRVSELKKGKAPFSKMYEVDEDGQVKMKSKFKKEYDKYFDDTDTGKPKKSIKELYNWLKKQFGAKALAYDSNGKEIEFTGDEEKDKAAMKTAVEAALKRMEALKDEVQGLTDSINDHEKALLEAEQKRNELLLAMRDNLMSLENKVMDAIVDMREREIEDLENLRDAIEESANKFIDGLSNALNKERQMYDMEDRESDLRSKQRRLAVLLRTGGSGSEIASLESEIESSQRDLYFEKLQELIDSIKEASDKEIERMDLLIDLMKELLEYEKAHGLLWNDVYTIMQQDSETIANFIMTNDSEWWNKSAVKTQEDLADAIFEAELWKAFVEDITGEDTTDTETDTEEEDTKKKKKKKKKKKTTDTSSTPTVRSHDHNRDGRKTINGKLHAICSICGRDMGLTTREDAIRDSLKKKETQAKGTLMGELGPELYVSNGRIHIAGKNGAEFEDLPKDAIVFNHRQTKQLLSNGKTGRGKAKDEDAAIGATTRQSLLDNFWSSLKSRKSHISQVDYPIYDGSKAINSIVNNDKGTNIENATVNMNVASIANDYDAKRAGELAMEEMLRIARKTNVTSLRR